MQATAVNEAFCRTSVTRKPGDLLERGWRRAVWGGGSQTEAELWRKRAVDYWALQAVKYGLVMDLANIEVHLNDKLPVVVTRCRILAVLPGRRVSEREWRAMYSPAHVAHAMETLH